MNTPICDFVNRYEKSKTMRLHMPGHKGVPLLGMEPWDLTEIEGADSLYEASGILRESETNASTLFGCPTYYSTEGSSHCIRAMLHLLCLHAVMQGQKPWIAAGRNAHKTFLSAAILLDFPLTWLWPQENASYLSCPITLAKIESLLQTNPHPTAIYLTSPDYLGNCADIAGIAKVCHTYGVLLAVDNAHGAYLHFENPPVHPIDLGADICCDSAHKTLPALTGCAYLHLSKTFHHRMGDQVKNALALFGSTSPSYLLLQSLDKVNLVLAEDYPEKLQAMAETVRRCKMRLLKAGYTLMGTESMKWTICAKPYGYLGYDMAAFLHKCQMECEFADPDYLVLMLTPVLGRESIERLTETLLSLPARPPIEVPPPPLQKPEQVCSPRQAAMAPQKKLPIAASVGRILASPGVSCPPAVPIVVCGERIDQAAVEAFRYYGIENCTVVAKEESID